MVLRSTDAATTVLNFLVTFKSLLLTANLIYFCYLHATAICFDAFDASKICERYHDER